MPCDRAQWGDRNSRARNYCHCIGYRDNTGDGGIRGNELEFSRQSGIVRSLALINEIYKKY